MDDREPGPEGGAMCGWCRRMIYLPALPCSVEPVEGLLRIATKIGQGACWSYELATRELELMLGL